MTDEIKTTITLRDLKQLGRNGGATARLEDGTELILKEHYAVKKERGFVDGILRDVEFHLSYRSIFNQIRTIKKDNHLVARKERSPSGTQLRLTGKGYKPESSKSKKRKKEVLYDKEKTHHDSNSISDGTFCS